VLLALEAFLVDVTRQGKRCLLVVDEAQNLTPRAVEELRMLSNFQFETQALLQSFLIGQPEFRRIMQSPHMQQLRQRVIAACHIGPMSQEETQAYIEHRLKCAGFSRSARLFDSGAYEAIFEASGGIPRRINALCDRLLLLGFLSGKKDFVLTDVQEVAKEIMEETQTPVASSRTGFRFDGVGGVDDHLTDSNILDINLSRLELDSNDAEDATRIIADLKSGLNDQRIVRLERSMIRIERSCAATLTLLQKLVDAIQIKQAEKPKRSEKENQS
jgi:hypothetical protein